MAVGLFIVGLTMVIKGGDYFVDAARWFSDVTGIPRFIVGATIVSVATTMPELSVSVFATLGGSIDMAVGNVIGTVTANIALIMAVSIIALPAKLEGNDFRSKGILMLFAALLLGIFMLDGNLSKFESLFLFAVLGLFIFENVISAKRIKQSCEETESYLSVTSRDNCGTRIVLINTAKFAGGLAGIIIGSKIIVDNAKLLAAGLGVSEAVIGLTIVAVGASLPELITTLSAIAKRESALSIGNVIGANIIDMTMILAVCSFITADGLPVSQRTLTTDLPVTLIVMALAIIPPLFTKRLMRWQGFALLFVYLLYMTHIIS
jgi:cation:H+ antiporter